MTAPLIRFNSVSLDGYIADAEGDFDWGTPDAEVHTFINELVRPARVHLYGRRNYEVMTAWEGMDLETVSPAEREFALEWAGIRKIVYSSTLPELAIANAELRREFDADEVARWKAESDTPLLIGGGSIASVAARAGVLDEVHVIVCPVFLGGGTRASDEGLRLDLALLEERRFGNGSVYLRYAVRG